jgi:hypothetical protein
MSRQYPKVVASGSPHRKPPQVLRVSLLLLAVAAVLAVVSYRQTNPEICPNPTAGISPPPNPGGTARGKVVDEDQRAISGARVFILGYKYEAVVTNIIGEFELPVRTGTRQPVYIQAENDSELTIQRWDPVTNMLIVFILHSLKGRLKMDKNRYCEELENKLQGLATYLETLNFPSPATLEASRQQAEIKLLVASLKTRIAAALAKVNALKTSTAPDWEPARQEIERQWQEISEIRKQIE